MYGLPICTCPHCGTSVVRRAHRFRTYPVEFKRLDRAFNRIALTLAVIVAVACSAVLIAAIASRLVVEHETHAWAALTRAVRSAPASDLLSIGLGLGIVAVVQILSGIVLARLLWHWTPAALAAAWLGVLALGAMLPTTALAMEVWNRSGPPGNAWQTIRLGLADRGQILAGCWLVTAAGIFAGSLGRPTIEARRGRRLRRSLRWARKQQARQRA